MPTMTTAMLDAAKALKGHIQTIDAALEAGRGGANTLMNQLYSVTGADAAAAHIGGNAVFKFKGTMKKLLGLMDEAHAELSTAAIVYDPVNGVDLVHHAPPGGPGGGR